MYRAQWAVTFGEAPQLPCIWELRL